MAENKTFYKKLLKGSTEIITVISSQAIVKFQSDNSLEYLGYESNAMLGKNFFTFVHPGDIAHLVSTINHALEGRLARPVVEFRFRHQDGHYLVLETYSWNLMQNKDMMGLALYSRDITQNRDRFFSLTMDIICIAGFDGFIKQANAAWLELLGFDAQEVQNQPLVDFISPDDKKTMLTKIQLVIKKERAISFANRILTKKGALKWFLWTITPFKDEEIIYAIGKDITERKVAEEKKLKESENRFRLMAENSKDMIARLSSEKIFLYVSPASLSLLGYKPPELHGQSMEKFIHPQDKKDFKDHFPLGESDSKTVSFRFRKKNNKYIYLETTLRTLKRIPDNNLTRRAHGSNTGNKKKPSRSTPAKAPLTEIMAVSRDITERIKTMDALVQSEKILHERNAIIEKDLLNAQIIQKAFLPEEIPPFPYLKIQFRFQPLDLVGGDYFCFYPLLEGGYGIFIGDVANHGVTAALFHSLLKFISDKICRKYAHQPQQFIKKLNTDLINYMPRSFLTGLYGFFLPDPKSAKLVFSFAKGGHPPPIHFDAGSGKSRFIKTKGTLIGEFPHIKIEEKKVELNIGDRLFLYTDGFPETFNGEKKMLGFDEILNVVDKSHDPDLSNSMDKILARIDIFREGEPLSDDIALIGFEVI